MKDFVDAIQTETAFYNGIGTIITRDKKDYVNIGIQVFNPLEYINDMSKIE